MNFNFNVFCFVFLFFRQMLVNILPRQSVNIVDLSFTYVNLYRWSKFIKSNTFPCDIKNKIYVTPKVISRKPFHLHCRLRQPIQFREEHICTTIRRSMQNIRHFISFASIPGISKLISSVNQSISEQLLLKTIFNRNCRTTSHELRSTTNCYPSNISHRVTL